jgi:glycosyltransferase 2 family protein
MRLDWRSALGILLSAALLWWTLKGESATEIWGALRAANVLWFLLATAVCMLIFPLRALRWRVILSPVAGRLEFGPLWRATCIGMMVNNVVPYRAGEFARAFALTREVPNIPFATALASLAVDRVFDFVVLLLLTFAPLLDPAFPHEASTGLPLETIARVGVGGVVVLLVGLYALVFFPRQIIRLFELATRRVAPSIERRGAEALAAFAEGLGVLRHPGRFAAVFAWTLVHWLVQAGSIWIAFFAVGIRLPFGAALLLNGVSSFASVLPAAPGFFGQFESASKVSLRVYGVRDSLAIAWALGYHVLTFIPITIIGAVYFARLGFSLRDMTSSGTRDERAA